MFDFPLNIRRDFLRRNIVQIKSMHGRFAPRAVAITFVVALAASGWVYGQQSAAPTPYPAEVPANRGLDATLYMQTAAEYRASCFQTYKWARPIQLEGARQGESDIQRPFAVIMDLG